MSQGRWIRWIGSAAASAALAILVMNADVFLNSSPDDSDIIVYLGIIILPIFFSIFLLAFGRFWWAFTFGLWISFIALVVCCDQNASPTSVILFLCAVTMCCTPFLNQPYRTKQPASKESAQQSAEGDVGNCTSQP